jgi:pimeloyl-ACP methyl ester carboxylesterase
VDEYIRVAKSDYDPYNVVRYAWSINREYRPAPLPKPADYDMPSLETLQTVFFRIRDPKFPERGEKRTVEIAATGKELPYTLWLQPFEAPLVYINPGFSSHRLSGGPLAVAELLFNAGFSVVGVSSTYNHEFMELAASNPLPGYTPADTRDLHSAFTKIDRDIEFKRPGSITSRSLLGYSMGGFQTLYLAGTEKNNTNALVTFDRYVAINPPVRLDYAIERLDAHYNSALNWEVAERTERINATFHKVAGLARNLDSLSPDAAIPLDSNESKFLVGLAFRVFLRDIIFHSQVKTNQGVLREDLNPWRREPVYREIMQYTFADYLEKFLTPYYQERGINLGDQETLGQVVDLRKQSDALRNNSKVRVIGNTNDILLAEEDSQWLREMFGKRVILFERGGHLGNLNETIVQHQIIRALADLRAPL